MKTLLALLTLLALATTAHADGDKGVYAGAGVGVFNVKIDSVQDVAPTLGKFDSDDVTFKAFMGWRFVMIRVASSLVFPVLAGWFVKVYFHE